MMGFGNMMGHLNSFWAVLCLFLIMVLVVGVVVTIVGMIKYSENKKDNQLIIWGIVALSIPIIIWGVIMAFSSNYFVDSNHNGGNSNMMDDY